MTLPRNARIICVYRCPDLPDRVRPGGQSLYTGSIRARASRVRGKARQRIRHRPQSMRPSACWENAGSPPEGANEMSSTLMPSASTAAADRRWHIIDAEGRVLGRIATLTARLLQGKHKARYTPFLDLGDHVVVVNAAKVKLTGRKEDQKIYRQHSGYEGGLREERARLVRQRKPERLVEDAVRGMLPKTKLGEAMYRKLKVYAGPDHPHAAQKPSKLEVA